MMIHRLPAVATLLHDGERALRAGLIVAAALAGLAVMLSGAGTGVDRQLQSWRDAIRSRPATGRLVLLEIDARSIAAVGRWPWPRTLHARAVRALNAAGVATIGFDVDFSARSSPAADAALADAIAASRAATILATFRQASSEGGRGTVENLPLAGMRAGALLGSVNIFADPDGLVRSYPFGVAVGGVPRPSVGALLAGSDGRINQSFPIDGAIDPASVSRVSFIDLIEGRVPAARLRGRTILVGASAIELGDRYPVPRHGVIPGALIQLLAAETLLQGTAPTPHGAAGPLLLVLLILPLAMRAGRRRRKGGLAAAGAGLLMLPLALEFGRLGTVAVAPALAALIAAAAVNAIADAVRAARIARTVDADTGLPNRRAFAEAIRCAGEDASIVGLRVDVYGDVLGVMGRDRAAELMVRTAERVAVGAAGPVHLVEENALAWLIEGRGEAAAAAMEATAALLLPGVEIAGRRLDPGGSLGVAEVLPDASADMIGRVLLAAETARADGRRWARYDDALDQALDWRLSLAGELDRAMAAGDIWVAYQPKLDLATDRIGAAEALVRWAHPVRGAISPADFVPALEASGKIYDLTLHVLDSVLAQVRQWQASGLIANVAVNVSALLPSDPRFASAVEALLARHGVPAGRITLEVTESASLNDPEVAIAALERLSAIGLHLSIDDYGTGQSTLSYLKRLPAREIKIDQSFVRSLDSSRSDQAMVRSTIQLAHELGFKVVAEGVETEAILAILRQFGCDVAQGWLIGRPDRAASLTPLLGAEAAGEAA